MTIDALMAQAVALRAQLEALVTAIEALRQEWPSPIPPLCPHDDIEDRSTFGHPNKRCRRCGEDLSGV